ncbi:MAG: GNAT family N-acetyltransferase [Chitinispirillia bacterium]
MEKLLVIKNRKDSELSAREEKNIFDFLIDSFQFQFAKLTKADCRYLAYLNDELVAHCAAVSREITIHKTPYEAYLIGGLCTLKEKRRFGFGSQLLAHVIESLQNSGRYFLILNCGRQLIPFYANVGFTVIAEKASYTRAGKIENDEDPVLAFILNDMMNIEDLRTEKVYLGEDF